MTSEDSASDDPRRKRKAIDPPQDEKKLRVSVCELLECPVCFNTMYPPVYQCFNGHLLCSGCKPGMENCCPTCRQELGNIRCLTLEKVAESLELSCKYQKLGCLDVVPYYNKLTHESQCSFRLYDCPSSGVKCSARGDIPFLVSHLKNCHNVTKASGSSVVQPFRDRNAHEAKNNAWVPVVYSCLEQHFCLYFEKFQLGVTWVYIAFLQLMGDEEEAKTYRYSLEFGANERKMIWQGVPRSIRESHRKVRDSLNGLIIESNLFFRRDNEKELDFKVNVKIWKAEVV